MLDHIHDHLGARLTSDMRDASLLTKQACDDLANEDLSALPNSAFAYCVGFGDRFYPCHTPEHLTLSRIYLHKYPENLSKKDFDAVSAYLEDVASAYGLPPLDSKSIRKTEEPVDELQQLTTDMFDFERNYRQMYIDARRKLANNLRARAEALGRTSSLPCIVIRYAGRHLAPNYMKAIEDRRQRFVEGSPLCDELFRLGMDADRMSVEALLAALKKFDEDNGLTAHYDDSLLDPYLGLLCDTPPSPKLVYRDGDHEIFEDDVKPARLEEKLKDLINPKLVKALCLDFADAVGRLRPEMKTVVLRAVAKPRGV